MNLKRMGVLAGLMAVVLAGCGPVDDVDPGTPEAVGTHEAAATYAECCDPKPGSTYSDSFCNSVAYSPERCNAVYSGTACAWNTSNCPVTCCRPRSTSTVSWSYCNQYAFSADRCNQVNGGSTCIWSC